MRRVPIVLVALLALAVLGWWWRAGGHAESVGRTARVERAPIERVVVASGTVEPEQLVDVRAKVSGIVERFLVDAGDRVRAAQVIAELDRDTLESAVREARAVVREAEVTRAHAASELRRREALFSRGVESEEVLDRMRMEDASAEARVARARATLERLEEELAWATITAPIDGLVLRRDLDLGAAVASVATVTGGTVVMTIADTSRMHLLGTVDENEIALVRVDQEARIRTDAYPDRVFPGRVRKIASLGDRKDNVTSFEVEVSVLDGADTLSPRMSGDADIVAERRPDALVIPETALIYEGEATEVEVVDHASRRSLTRRPVRTGIFQGDRVEIVDGLKEGEEVKLQ
jgi:HlyD family secretion protein